MALAWRTVASAFYANKDEYMERLFRVSSHGDWTGWIRFCLLGVVEQAADTEARCEHLLLLATSFKERVISLGGSWRLQSIVDQLFITPVVQIPYLAERHEVSYHTAKADVEKLLSVGVLEEFSDASQKTYFSPDVLHITYQ